VLADEVTDWNRVMGRPIRSSRIAYQRAGIFRRFLSQRVDDIDLRVFTRGNDFERGFRVHAGAHLEQLEIDYQGIERVEITLMARSLFTQRQGI
jgi:hypothetical protein